MAMFKVGQRVSLVFNINRLGTITEIRHVRPTSWSTGGPLVDGVICVVRFDDGVTETRRQDDLRQEFT